jgi:hypothetical protein
MSLPQWNRRQGFRFQAASMVSSFISILGIPDCVAQRIHLLPSKAK